MALDKGSMWGQTLTVLLIVLLGGRGLAIADTNRSTPPATTAPSSDSSTSSSTASKASPSLDELLLFFPAGPTRGNWKPTGLIFEDVWFKADDGTRLHGWYCPCKRANAVVLYAHGNGANLSFDGGLMKYLQNGVRATALIFDYRGYGRSEGTPTVEGVLQDARAARTFLAKRAEVKESDIVLMGRSLGGAVVTKLAAESPPRGLILESTFSSLRDVATVHYPKLAWLVPADKLNSVAGLGQYKGPLFQSHGDADRVIPFAEGEKLFKAAKGLKEFFRVRDADHNDRPPDSYYVRLTRFIHNLPKTKPGSP